MDNTLKKKYLNVVLTSDDTILEIDTNIETLVFDEKDIIGKNWLDTFVDVTDQIEASNFLRDILNGKNNNLATFSYDIKSYHGNHEYIDFKYEIVQKNDKTLIRLFGKPHYSINRFA